MQFNNDYISCKVLFTETRKINLEGNIKNSSNYEYMLIMAAHTIDRITSYTGSGLPWTCPGMAFENTPNRIEVPSDGNFKGTFSYPNAYYTNDAFTKIPPSIFVVLKPYNSESEITMRLELPEDEILKLRTLTYRNGFRNGPNFYNKEEVMGVPTSAYDAMIKLKEYKSKYDIA